MLKTIESLDDLKAQQILRAVARSRLRNVGDSIPWSPGIGQTLADQFQVADTALQVSDGDLARQALQVLADDPDTRQTIEAMASASASDAQKFDFGATIALTTAILLVLQTHVRFERTTAGKWSLTVEKKPTSDALLKGLVQKLISYAK